MDGQVFVNEPLIVAQVQIGLGPILGDEDLSVLERAHGAGIDIQVGVKLLDGDLVPPGLEKPAQGGGGNALSKAGYHAAGDENILDCHNIPSCPTPLPEFYCVVPSLLAGIFQGPILLVSSLPVNACPDKNCGGQTLCPRG